MIYPETPAERTRWILEQRLSAPRYPADPWRASGWNVEQEPDETGTVRSALTIFLTNRECPWRCLMCDLWRHTLTETVPDGAIPAQIDAVLAEQTRPASWIKLYNAGSFFDSKAIPPGDHPAIARRCGAYSRVIVECHPGLVHDRILRFRDMLPPETSLEVAMGLETAHPDVLEKLNKRMRLHDYKLASKFLKAHRIGVRAFILVRPPFLDESQALEWARKSIDFAFDVGVDVVSLIPTRFGNGALEALQQEGLFAPPSIETLEAALDYGLSLKRGRVFADLWDLERLVPADALPEWRARLEARNLSQR